MTFHEALQSNASSRLNRVHAALTAVTRAVPNGRGKGARKRAAIENLADLLRSGDTRNASDADKRAVAEIRKVLNDTVSRMREAGIDIGEVQNYFPVSSMTAKSTGTATNL